MSIASEPKSRETSADGIWISFGWPDAALEDGRQNRNQMKNAVSVGVAKPVLEWR
ncbi:unnamed protein product [Boreogadus saida]